MFLALNVPGGREPEFCQGLWQWFYIWYNFLHTLTEFQKKTMDGSNVMRGKVSFLATLGHFRAFLAIKEPLGTQRELFSKIWECYISPIWICNFMQNFRKIQWIVIENFWNARTHARTHGRTGGRGWILRSQFRLKSGDKNSGLLDKHQKSPQKGCFSNLRKFRKI